MSDYPAYDAVLQALQAGGVVVDDKYKAIGDAATTLCDVNQTVSQIPDASVVRNRDGDVIGYDYKYTGPKLPDTGIMEVDSNTDNGWYASGGGGQSGGGGAGRYNGSYYAGKVVIDPQSTDKLTGGSLVSGNVSASWAITSVLSKLGKKVAEITADTLEAADLHFGTQFGPLCVDTGVGTGDIANAIRALFGVDSQGNTTMYLDEDVIGAAAIVAKDDGFFSSGGEYELIDYTVPSGPTINSPVKFVKVKIDKPIYSNNALTDILGYTYSNTDVSSSRAVIFVTPPAGEFIMVYPKTGGGSVHFVGVEINDDWVGYTEYLYVREYNGCLVADGNRRNYQIPVTATFDGKSIRHITISTENTSEFKFIIPESAYTSNTAAVLWACKYNQSSGGTSVPGVSDQTGATIPVDAITGADPHVVAQNLESQYPTVMGTPIQIVVMDDSCNEVTKNYYAVPISYSPTNLNINAPITGGLQVSPSFNPDVTLDLPDIDMDNYIDQVIKILGGSGAGRDVTTEPEPDDPTTPSMDIDGGTLPTEPPATGTGETPLSTLPVSVPSALWHVYNPSTSDLSTFGQWLWAGAFDIAQWRRIFQNPMDAVIGVHALYGAPVVSGTGNIVCGNIACPDVTVNLVSQQYTSVDCGSVWLTEYFGNVFDYEPYTSVSIFLPFIGVIPLSVADIMRAKLSVNYNIDVYTGACNCQVSVERDGVGGVLYQFGGNCAVTYPISGISYTSIMAAMTTVAASIAGVAAGVIDMPIAIAAAGMNVASNTRGHVSRSGGFSGNSGAMGSKKPYLIISRPITEMAVNFEQFDGLPANKQVRLSECTGYTKCKEVHFSAIGAYKSEQDEIESLLRTGIIL